MKIRVPRQYKPAELQAAIEALQKNQFHNFHEGDAAGIVKSLHQLGFRIVQIADDPEP